MKKNKNQNEKEVEKEIEEALVKLHEALPQAVETLIELSASKNTAIRDRASREIRERLMGKPTKIFRLE